MDEVSGNSANPRSKPAPVKIRGVPVQRTKKQIAAQEKAAELKKEADDLAVQKKEIDAVAARTAQIANLLIAGHTFESIGAAIGSTAAEVERMIASDSARYVRSQASLRIWVRNWISGKYSAMIEADWDVASDPLHPHKLEHQDRVGRFLGQMGRLHGAEAPTQSEVKVEAAPESIERMVQKLAAQQGTAYDMDIFDVPPEDITEELYRDPQMAQDVHQAPQDALRALEQASENVEKPQPGDDQPEETL